MENYVAYVKGLYPDTNADVVLHTGRTITIRGTVRYRLPEFCEANLKQIAKFYQYLSRCDCKFEVERVTKKAVEAPVETAVEAPVEKAVVPDWAKGKNKAELISLATEFGVTDDMTHLSKAEIIELANKVK